MTRALITGASGFCGRHLAGYLAARGVDVHTLRAFARGEPTSLAGLELPLVVEAIRRARPDYVFHLAGVAVAAHPATPYVVNVAYAATLLRALEEAGYGDRPVLLVGTAAEYGRVDPHQLPIAETCPPAPYNDYGVSKLAQTQLGLAAASRGRRIVIARPFNIIGPGMPGHLALQSFAQQMVEIRAGAREPVLRVGNLDSARDFIDVEDVVEAYWNLIHKPDAYGQIVNVCSGVPITIRAALRLLLDAAGLAVEIREDAARMKAIDIPVHYGCREKLERLLGTSAPTPLERSIEHIVTAVLSS
ncbi:MAG: NAD-dependent epimerase/dehydratase family protein [Vicinamibacterales bacterium]